MEFVYQSWNVINFAPELYQICIYFANTMKVNINVGSPHFLMFSANYWECKIVKKDGHGKLRNDHGKVMEKYFVKSMGTLLVGNYHPLYMAPESLQLTSQSILWSA